MNTTKNIMWQNVRLALMWAKTYKPEWNENMRIIFASEYYHN